jgi:hypothetical protein
VSSWLELWVLMPLIYYIQFLNRVYPNNRCDYTLKVVVKLTLSVELEG